MDKERITNFVRFVCNYHRSGHKPDIFIFSTPRSGSTWLMELILSERGVKPCNEPFNLRKREVTKALGISEWATLYRDSALPLIEEYLSGFMKGTSRSSFRNLRPFQTNYNFFTNRIVFKVLHAAENRFEWIQEKFGAKIILLTRHPIPVSLSREDLPRLNTFINSDYARDLPEEKLGFARSVVKKGTFLEKAVLDWCLQNAIPLSDKASDFMIVTYEQLVLDPEPIVTFLIEWLDLTCGEEMRKALSRPSGSTTKSSTETRARLRANNRADREWLIKKWKDDIDTNEERRLMNIVSRFDISIYRYGSVLPSEEYWRK